RYLGAAGRARRRGGEAACRLPQEAGAMMAGAKFRVALSGDFLRADGTPQFPDFDVSPLQKDPRIEFAYLPRSDVIEAAQIADYDALILLGLRFARSSIHPNGRLAMVARLGAGSYRAALPACTQANIALVITPDGVRRPVAVGIMTLMLALAGRLRVKDQLARQGPAGYAQRTQHMGVG